MAEVVGVARIDLTGDASGVEAAVARAKKSIDSMSREAQAHYSKLSAAEKRRVDALTSLQGGHAIRRIALHAERHTVAVVGAPVHEQALRNKGRGMA